TTYLFNEGVDKILKKVGEEASEVIIAAKNRDHQELTPCIHTMWITYVRFVYNHVDEIT
ncbi:phosphoribosyl-ATP diphosphatase, partial [Pantoea sp. SIMBA_133]